MIMIQVRPLSHNINWTCIITFVFSHDLVMRPTLCLVKSCNLVKMQILVSICLVNFPGDWQGFHSLIMTKWNVLIQKHSLSNSQETYLWRDCNFFVFKFFLVASVGHLHFAALTILQKLVHEYKFDFSRQFVVLIMPQKQNPEFPLGFTEVGNLRS